MTSRVPLSRNLLWLRSMPRVDCSRLLPPTGGPITITVTASPSLHHYHYPEFYDDFMLSDVMLHRSACCFKTRHSLSFDFSHFRKWDPLHMQRRLPDCTCSKSKLVCMIHIIKLIKAFSVSLFCNCDPSFKRRWFWNVCQHVNHCSWLSSQTIIFFFCQERQFFFRVISL